MIIEPVIDNYIQLKENKRIEPKFYEIPKSRERIFSSSKLKPNKEKNKLKLNAYTIAVVVFFF